MKALEAYRKAILALPEGIREAEVEAETEGELSVMLQNGAHNGAALSEVTSLFVRTLGEKAGFTYTQNLEEAPEEVLLRAHESSLYSDSKEMLLHEPGDAGVCERKEPECEPVELSRLWEKAEAVEQWLVKEQPNLAVRQIAVTDRIRTLGLVNSKGCDSCVSGHSFCITLFALDPRYPGNFFIKELTVPALSEISEELFSERLKKWYWILEAAAIDKTQESFVAGNYPCVLDGSVMNNIFLTAWKMFTAENYQKKTTPFAGKRDMQIGGSVLNITDRITRKGSGYRFQADCEGSESQDVKLVTNGVLTGLMSNLTSGNVEAAEAGVRSTGNAGRKAMISGNIHTDVVTIPKNFGIEPGTHSLQELLEEMGDGIYIYESFDMFHSVNTVSGEFTIPCNGILIKDGKPNGVVKGLTISGKVQDILADTRLVGKDTDVCPMLMLNSFTVASPGLLVEKLNVSK